MGTAPASRHDSVAAAAIIKHRRIGTPADPSLAVDPFVALVVQNRANTAATSRRYPADIAIQRPGTGAGGATAGLGKPAGHAATRLRHCPWPGGANHQALKRCRNRDQVGYS